MTFPCLTCNLYVPLSNNSTANYNAPSSRVSNKERMCLALAKEFPSCLLRWQKKGDGSEVGNLRKTEDTMMKGDGMGGLLFGVYAWFTVIARQSKRVTAYLHITRWRQRQRRRQLDEKRGGGRQLRRMRSAEKGAAGEWIKIN